MKGSSSYITTVNTETKKVAVTGASFGVAAPVWAGNDKLVWAVGDKFYSSDASLADVSEVKLENSIKGIKPWGSKLLVSAETRGDGGARKTEYFTLDSDGTNLTSVAGLNDKGALFENVRLLADGNKIVYLKGTAVHVANADGSGDKELSKEFIGGIQSLGL